MRDEWNKVNSTKEQKRCRILVLTHNTISSRFGSHIGEVTLDMRMRMYDYACTMNNRTMTQ